MTKINKNLYLDSKKIKEWESFCEINFKTTRILSKIITEAMDMYIQEYNKKKFK